MGLYGCEAHSCRKHRRSHHGSIVLSLKHTFSEDNLSSRRASHRLSVDRRRTFRHLAGQEEVMGDIHLLLIRSLWPCCPEHAFAQAAIIPSLIRSVRSEYSAHK